MGGSAGWDAQGFASVQVPGEPVLDAVRHIAIAWKNLTAYSPGHPAAQASLAQAHRRLHDLISAGGELTFGVARDALLCGDQRFATPHARDLARALYVREVALITFEPGLAMAELQACLGLIGGEARHAGRPPIAEELAAAGVVHIRVEAVDFSQVKSTDTIESAPAQPENLWESVLQALLAGQALSAESQHLMDSGAAGVPQGFAALVRQVLGGEASGRGSGEAGAADGVEASSAAREEPRDATPGPDAAEASGSAPAAGSAGGTDGGEDGAPATAAGAHVGGRRAGGR